MPILPLNHTEPFAATLGVMLYPAVDKIDPPKARAFAALWLAKQPLRRFHEAGHRLSYGALARLIMDAGQDVSDHEERLSGGLVTGNLFKAFYILAKNHPDLASWENAIRIYGVMAKRAQVPGSRSFLEREKRRFLTVAHLWGAWSIREGTFQRRPEVAYDGFDDFQSFLTEAEILRNFGQTWRQSRQKSEPPLPTDVWRAPEDWNPPPRRPGWPPTGIIPDLALPKDLLIELRPAGRPRKVT